MLYTLLDMPLIMIFYLVFISKVLLYVTFIFLRLNSVDIYWHFLLFGVVNSRMDLSESLDVQVDLCHIGLVPDCLSIFQLMQSRI